MLILKITLALLVFLHTSSAQCTGQNEVFKNCPTSPTPCDQFCDDRSISGCQSRPCSSGCYCRPGFFRNYLNKCIRPSGCDRCEGRNEDFLACPDQCPQTCQNVILGVPKPTCEVPNPCSEGCNCAENFLRDENTGTCVAESQCVPLVCPENETPTLCANTCEQTCSNNLLGISAPEPCITNCLPGCECIEGFIRADDNTCVSADTCPPLDCGVNEMPTLCDNACEQTCTNNILGIPIPDPCLIDCEPGCICLEGFVRQGDSCISQESCPPKVCGSNEVAVLCDNECEQTCDNSILGIAAPAPCSGTEGCVLGCDCAPGFYRNALDLCVPSESCPPKTCGINEIPVLCDNTCEQTCYNNILGISEPTPCTTDCEVGCDCPPGFVRVGEGVCTSVELCPPKICSRDNEVPTLCDNTCEQTCSNNVLGIPAPEPCRNNCVQGCDCADGYFRDPSDNCVPESSCEPPSCGENEVVVFCDNTCEQTCNNVINGVASPVPCIETPCQGGCDCAPGYVRADDGSCVLQSMCVSSEMCTGPNEVIVTCDNTCEQTCTRMKAGDDSPAPCFTKPCVAGCDCAPGYVRDPKNVCISKRHCSPCQSPAEIFTRCLPLCQPSCFHKRPICTPLISPNGHHNAIYINNVKCIEGCMCRPGFYKNIFGHCVTRRDCKRRPEREHDNYYELDHIHT